MYGLISAVFGLTFGRVWTCCGRVWNYVWSSLDLLSVVFALTCGRVGTYFRSCVDSRSVVFALTLVVFGLTFGSVWIHFRRKRCVTLEKQTPAKSPHGMSHRRRASVCWVKQGTKNMSHKLAQLAGSNEAPTKVSHKLAPLPCRRPSGKQNVT